TPSVFASLPKLLERAGTGPTGSITAFYTVLVDGDDMNEPIADAVRGILDGHIVLNRGIANKGHFPAIDVLASISRVMKDIAPRDQIDAAENIKRLMAVYKDSEDLINIGAYQQGSNAEIDESMERIRDIWDFTRQRTDEKAELDEVRERLISEFTRR
ncbi:flagellum-specific ATP synthase FliI, partial [Paenibacillus sp. 28ISP30-2]|nr:flagellum-specific ATP synthase FliI [Paenibacillus sp. 28ISP30-2]